MVQPSMPMNNSDPVSVPYQEFRSGLPEGRFRLIVNPQRAQKYVSHRLFVVGIALPLVGIGTALSLSSYPWLGLPMILVGALLHRIIKAQATKILLHLALHDSKTYLEAIDFEILEVRYATAESGGDDPAL